MASRRPNTSTGIEEHTEALLAYSFWWASAFLFLLLERKSEFVRFHAFQSLVTFGAITLATMVPIIGWLLSPFLMLLGFILWLFLMYKAFAGERYKLPVIGDFVEREMMSPRRK